MLNLFLFRHTKTFRASLSFLLPAALTVAGCGGSTSPSVAPTPTPPAPATPDFTLSGGPQSLPLALSGTVTFNLSASAINGFTGTVAVTLSNLPAGVTASSTSLTLTPGIATPITLTASSTVTAQLAAITLTGTSSTLTHTAQVQLTIGTVADYRLTTSAQGVSLVPGSSQSLTVTASALNGFTGTAIPASITGLPTGVTAAPASFTLTPGTPQTVIFTASSSPTNGNTFLTVSSTSGTITHTTPIVLNVGTQTQDFVLTTPISTNIASGGTTPIYVFALGKGGFAGTTAINITGLPTGVTASPSSFNLILPGTGGLVGPTTQTNSQTVTLTAATGLTLANTSFTVTATSGALSHQNSVLLTTAPTQTETATINPTNPGVAFPPYFVGFSIPDQPMQEFTGTGTTTYPSFVNMILNLKPYIGSPNLRETLEGSATLLNEWKAFNTAVSYTTSSGTVTPQWYFTVPSTFASSAYPTDIQSVISDFGSANVEGIELDNEPDQLIAVNDRPATYTFADYLTESATYQKSFASVVTAPQYIGDAASNVYQFTWDLYIPAILAQESGQISTWTAHQYALSNCNKPAPTTAQLLADAPAHVYYGRFAPLVQTLGSIPVRIGEMNSASCSGTPGVSNAFAASLWLVDALFEGKSAGVSGFNLQSTGNATSGAAAYDMAFINSSGQASINAPYYGVLFFSQAIQNTARPIPVTITQSTGNIKIWATIDKSSNVRVVILEKDTDGLANTHTISLNLGTTYTSPGVLTVMSAPTVASTSGITIAGQTFDGTTSGLLAGTATSTTVTPVNNLYTFTVQDGTAVLLTIS